MNIIIAGDGHVGSTLAKQLCAEGHDVTIVDHDQSVLDDTLSRYDVMAVWGNCASMPTLIQAGVMDADLLIAATSADEINMLCCTTAHGLNPKLHTIAVSAIRNIRTKFMKCGIFSDYPWRSIRKSELQKKFISSFNSRASCVGIFLPEDVPKSLSCV